MSNRLRTSRLLWPTVFAAAAFALLLGLGTWQWQRKAWKAELIVRITERMASQAVDFDEAIRSSKTLDALEYRRVTARGRFDHDSELFVYEPQAAGPGFHVYTPLRLDSSLAGGAAQHVLVNRGFVPQAKKPLDTRRDGAADGIVTVTGLVRLPRAVGQFTPPPDEKSRVWYDRDFSAFMKVLASDGAGRRFHPVYLEAEATANPGPWPRGGVTLVRLPNRHLEYALTWWALAATLLGVYSAFAIDRLRKS